MEQKEQTSRPARAPFWIAVGFLSAFGASVLTVVLTGLAVRSPRTEPYRTSAPAAERADESEPAPDRARRPDAELTNPLEPASSNARELADSPELPDSNAPAPPGSSAAQ